MALLEQLQYLFSSMNIEIPRRLISKEGLIGLETFLTLELVLRMTLERSVAT